MSKTKSKKKLLIFTDGSCAGNGKASAVGGIGIHFPNGELKDVSKIFRLGNCTNQRTELYAILMAIKYVKQNFSLSKYKLKIMSDSEYSINCITKWVYGWIKNGWVTKNGTPVSNSELIEQIHNYYEKYDIELEHVDAHTGGEDAESIANARADELATRATEKAKKESKPIKKNYTGSKTSKIKKSSKSSKSSKPIKKYTKKKSFSSTKKYPSKYSSGSSSLSSKGFPSHGNFSVELVKSHK
jgi:ribonuclease HI